MAKLTLYTNYSIRASAARQQLNSLGIDYIEVNVDQDADARDFLDQQRPIVGFPPPQYYVGDQLVWPEGFHQVSTLTAEQINQKIEEINASSTK